MAKEVTFGRKDAVERIRTSDAKLMASGHDYFFQRGIKEYDRELGIESERIVTALIEKHGMVNVLDVGCGAGNYPLELEQAFPGKVTGFGISLSEYTHQLRNYHVGDAAKMPYAADFFHHIVSLDALDLDPRPLDTLKETIRVLSRGCKAFLRLKNGDGFWERHNQEIREMIPATYANGKLVVQKL